MDYMTYNGIQYEISVLSLAHEAGIAVELVELSPDGSLLAEARVTNELVTLVRQEPMPAVVYEWWASVVVETARPGVDDEA